MIDLFVCCCFFKGQILSTCGFCCVVVVVVVVFVVSHISRVTFELVLLLYGRLLRQSYESRNGRCTCAAFLVLDFLPFVLLSGIHTARLRMILKHVEICT